MFAFAISHELRFSLYDSFFSFYFHLNFTYEVLVNVKLIKLKKIKNWELIDFCFMTYAIHYMFGSKEGFDSFANVINHITMDNAVFVTNIIDMSTALPYINDKNKQHTKCDVVRIGNYNLSIPFNNIFNISLSYKSIQGDGTLEYSSEPVLTSDTLITQMKNIGWELIEKNTTNIIAKDFQLYNNEDKEWVKHHVFFIFKKNK